MSSNTRTAKIQIPRLDRRENPDRAAAESSKSRVPRACLACRSRKVKCNGARPACKNCEDSNVSCVYSSSRKDRLKTATSHNQHLLNLLRDLKHRVDSDSRTRIEEALASITDDVTDAALATGTPDTHRTPAVPPEDRSDDERGEANVSAEVGSDEDLDLVDEDLLRDQQSRATGFVGKTSDIQWLRRLDHETKHGPRDTSSGPYGPPGSSHRASLERVKAMKKRKEKDPDPKADTSSLSYYLDDQPFDLDYLVDAWELPPFATAERLLNCYMTRVHDTFPIVAKKALVGRFYQYYASVGRGQVQKIPQRWQGMLNIIFAIGAVYSHLAEEHWRADDRDHLVYHSRAWALTLKDPWWFSHPDLPQLQINGLLAFYYLAIGQVNRSWMVSGMAVRSGFALGLHLRNEDRTATAVKKEILRRVWWGLYSLESALSSLTGRPSVAFASHISIPLPLPLSTEEIDEAIILTRFGGNTTATESPEHLLGDTQANTTTNSIPGTTKARSEPTNSGSYLKATAKISMIMQKSLSVLYSPDASTKSWEDAQNMIVQLNEQLDIWAASLPPGFAFESDNLIPHHRDRSILEMSYYGARIMINRPCLCRLHRHIEHQSQASDDFNRRTAELCVKSATDIADCLPDDPDLDRARIYRVGPWWSMVHVIMQALTILLLELAYNVTIEYGQKEIIKPLRKLLQWLRAMRATNTMAEKAHGISVTLLKRLESRIDVDITDMIEDVQKSPARTSSISTDRAEGSENMPMPNASDSGDRERYHSNTRHTLEPTSEFLFEDQIAFLGPNESETSASSDYFVRSFPQNTAFTNLFVTVYDEQNPFPFTEGEFVLEDLDITAQNHSYTHFPSNMQDSDRFPN
ncbi:hypothetical protein BU24DRAFT_417747 [Aaosphaeria arxii CBS 175.79]|uniref:Zn(2)-C6 fungal-type domain-containing protein n=1 Tax=Aaosphaeria arxii CBS 175.79 TaxID=1450172 RepID=A0A6A5YBU8_9PLEO|nr:uncharacterized protein BU24DRAFT_417747 [Aaosphaeria arxii CBS 175.79]KAF2022094.1 hypothetical protein BU24DRAFT_417747 [Aaosphaeria arxii CBS 175.79]